MALGEPFRIDDAEEVEDFLAKAKEAWYERHPEKRKHRGRPYDERIIEAIKEDFKARPRKMISQYSRVYEVGEILRAKYDKAAPKEDAVYRYVKVFMLLKRTFEDGQMLSVEQLGWLDKNFPGSEKAIDHLTDALVAIVPVLSRIGHDIEILRNAFKQRGIDTTSKKFDRLVSSLINVLSSPA